MITGYWFIFNSAAVLFALSLVMFFLGALVRKGLKESKYRKTKMTIYYVFCALLALFSARHALLCALDMEYVKEQKFTVIECRVESFTYIREGNSPDDPVLKNPKVVNLATGESLVLHLGGVEVDGIYTVRYLPHTKLAEVVKDETEAPHGGAT